MNTVARIAVDAVAVGAFALIGRSSHHETPDLLGVLQTATPFWLGTAVGWVVCRFGARKTWLGEGVAVWLSTLVVGHLVRAIIGPNVSPVSFVIVSAIALAVFLIGWRALYALATRRKA